MKNPFLTTMTEKYLRVEDFSDEEAQFAAHAINQHDKLVEAYRKALSYLPAKDGKRTGDPDGDVQLMICNELAALLDEEKP